MLSQFSTVSDLYQQQVLDNLAMFVYDPHSLPYFNVLSTGVGQVTDTGTIQQTLTLARVSALNLFAVSSETTSPALTRVCQDNWSANPVTDPRRLELMRCAYQKVVGANMATCTNGATPAASCPDCTLRWKAFYGVDRNQDIVGNGRVTSDCLGTTGQWFGWGRKKNVPKHCSCLQVSHYCGVYVWILPNGREEFSKLVLAILDYAINQPACSLTKDVTLNFDADGNLITDKNKPVAKTVKATIPIEASSDLLWSIEKGPYVDVKRDLSVEQQRAMQQSLRPVETFQNTQPPDFQFLNQRLQQLNPPR